MLPPNRGPRRPAASGDFQKPGVVFQPETYKALQEGLNLIVDVVRPTLGPVHRMVGVDHPLGRKPELLDSGATIARRIERILGRNRDMGAMFTRHVLWQLQQRVGDGTATAAVLLQSIFNQGVTYLAAGGNAQLLRAGLESSLPLILSQLERMARPIAGKERLARYAESVSNEPELSSELGQAMDILGPYGRLEVRVGRGRETRHEFVQGIYWEEGVLHPDMIEDKVSWRSVLLDSAILATDLEIKEVEDTLHLLELAAREGMSSVLLICRSLEGAALAPLLNPANRALVKVVAVKLPGAFSDKQTRNLTDIAILTGARPLLSSAGAALRHVRVEDFGQARQAWAYRETFGFTTGKGDPRQIRAHVEGLRKGYLAAQEVDKRVEFEQRLGRVLGGSATLWIGAPNQEDFERLKDTAERTSRALRAAMIGGVVPGGGSALLACRGALEEELPRGANEETRLARRILTRACEVPFRTLLWNAGIEQGQASSLMGRLQPGECFDLRRQEVVEAHATGLVDSLNVLKQAVHSAVSSAALLLTTDVLVHLKNPPEIYNT